MKKIGLDAVVFGSNMETKARLDQAAAAPLPESSAVEESMEGILQEGWWKTEGRKRLEEWWKLAALWQPAGCSRGRPVADNKDRGTPAASLWSGNREPSVEK